MKIILNLKYLVQLNSRTALLPAGREFRTENTEGRTDRKHECQCGYITEESKRIVIRQVLGQVILSCWLLFSQTKPNLAPGFVGYKKTKEKIQRNCQLESSCHEVETDHLLDHYFNCFVCLASCISHNVYYLPRGLLWNDLSVVGSCLDLQLI